MVEGGGLNPQEREGVDDYARIGSDFVKGRMRAGIE